MLKKYKSILERDFAEHLLKKGIHAEYEKDKIPYVRQSHYLPDWKIAEGLYLETKGEFSPSQRNNLLSFLEQHPKVEIIMIFAQANNKLNRKSKTTYGEWCKKHGIKFHNLDAQYNPKTKKYKFKNQLKNIKWLSQK